MKSKLFVIVSVVVLTAFAAAPIAAAPSASPCAPGATYDPTCDVNQDGAVNVLDVQLTAGHWNQTGTWTGGGDGWLLAGNAGTDPTNHFVGTTDGQPLVIQPGAGNVGIGTTSPQSKLSVDGTGWFQGSSTPLPAEAGAGVGIGYAPAWQAGYLFAFDYGTYTPKKLLLQSPGGKVGIGVSDVTPLVGKFQVSAGPGEAGVVVDSAGNDGIDVRSAASGVVVESASVHGVRVTSADGTGVRVVSAGSDGVSVGSAAGDGLYVDSAGYNGVYANTRQANGQWGFYTDDAIHGSNVLMHSLSLVAQVTGSDSLTSGDIVAVAGVADPVPGSTVHMPLVRLADGSATAIAGVVESRLVLTEKPSHSHPSEGETPVEAPASELRSVDGPAQPGDYVAITVLGATQVKVQAGEAIQAGQRLTISNTPGQARALRTVEVEGVKVDESGPTLGVALEPAKDGMVWVLVYPQ